jgi:hypothetical protein
MMQVKACGCLDVAKHHPGNCTENYLNFLLKQQQQNINKR